MKNVFSEKSFCKSKTLLFYQIIYYLFAVAHRVETDVYPTGALCVTFHDQLIKWQVVADVCEPLLALLNIAVQEQVNGLPLHVLAVCYAAHGLVERGTAISAGDDDRFSIPLAQWFQYLCNQCCQVGYLLHAWRVLDAELLGCVGITKLFEREMAGKDCAHN